MVFFQRFIAPQQLPVLYHLFHLFFIIAVVSLPITTDAFSTTLLPQKQQHPAVVPITPSTATSTLYASSSASSSSWFSSLSQETDFEHDPSSSSAPPYDPVSFSSSMTNNNNKNLKVLYGENHNRVMNQIHIPGHSDEDLVAVQQATSSSSSSHPHTTTTNDRNVAEAPQHKLFDRMQMEQTLAGRDGKRQQRKVRASVKETGYDSMRSYIKTMCNHELLNKNEEVVLAREIQLLIKWEAERDALEEALLRSVRVVHVCMCVCVCVYMCMCVLESEFWSMLFNVSSFWFGSSCTNMLCENSDSNHKALFIYYYLFEPFDPKLLSFLYFFS